MFLVYEVKLKLCKKGTRPESLSFELILLSSSLRKKISLYLYLIWITVDCQAALLRIKIKVAKCRRV